MTAATAQSSAGIIRYHFGRLLGYLSLGAIAGTIGQELFGSRWFSNTVPWVAVLTIGGGLIFLGFRLWNDKSPHFQIISEKTLAKLYRKSGFSPFYIGALSALLPCGWLHTYVLGAVATQSLIQGTLFLFAFWLGTLPAMSFAPALVQKFLTPLSRRAPKVSAVVLICAGFLSIGSKMAHHFHRPSFYLNSNQTLSLESHPPASEEAHESCH